MERARREEVMNEKIVYRNMNTGNETETTPWIPVIISGTEIERNGDKVTVTVLFYYENEMEI